MAILPKIKQPADLKKLSLQEMSELAREIREKIITVTSRNGGHIGPNLGVVELTLALHRVLNSPRDKIVYDVGHQSYVHKLLTGRQSEGFENLRKTDGLSGFTNRNESEHDPFGAGHAGTALSAALGMAVARDRRGGNESVVAFIGDASLTCGITLEALNNVSVATKKLIVVLNDNEWSISKNVGAIAKYLNELITNPLYNRLHQDLGTLLPRLPGGESLLRLGSKAKKEAKDLIVPSSLFEKLDLRYIGPIDGHNIEELLEYLEFCVKSDEPVVLHVLTQKGQGYAPAVQSPEKFHGSSPFIIETGQSKVSDPDPPLSYQDAFGKTLLKLASKDPDIMGITAAMPPGTGLSHLKNNLPGQFFDVGIAEEHAVVFAAGMATQGLKPVVAIYSTFLQRAYDPIIHDVCLQNLPVVFCMDRAGLSANDGPTHHGLFDIAYLRCVPNAVIMQPGDEDEQADMLWTALQSGKPCFIRYPRGAGEGKRIKPVQAELPLGRAEVVREGKDAIIWALGPWVAKSCAIAEKLEQETGRKIGVVNARFVKPLDRDLLLKQAAETSRIITLEDGVLQGGFGSAVLEVLSEAGIYTPVERFGWPDEFIEHGSSNADLYRHHGLDESTLLERIRSLLPVGVD